MSSVTSSSVASSLAGLRRRAAIWLITAWAIFSVSQALANCCVDAGHPSPTSTRAMPASDHHDAAAHDDCCDTSGDASGQPCSMVFGETQPTTTTTWVSTAPDKIQYFYPIPPSVKVSPRAPAAMRAHAPARIAAAAPPDPIYLRLRRFLI